MHFAASDSVEALVPSGGLPQFVLFSIPTAYLAYVTTGANVVRLLLLPLMSTSPGRSLLRLSARHGGDSGAGPPGLERLGGPFPSARGIRSWFCRILFRFLFSLALGSLSLVGKGASFLCFVSLLLAPCPRSMGLLRNYRVVLPLLGRTFAYFFAGSFVLTHSFCLVLTCSVLLLLFWFNTFRERATHKAGACPPSFCGGRRDPAAGSTLLPSTFRFVVVAFDGPSSSYQF